MKHLGCVTYPIPGCGIDVIKSEFPNEASVGTHKGFDFFSFFFKFYFVFKLYIIVLVLPNIKMNSPQVYMCSPS